MGREKRKIGTVLNAGGHAMVFLRRTAGGGEDWGCGKCCGEVVISPTASVHRGQRGVFLRHQLKCVEVWRPLQGGVRLVVTGGVPKVVVSRGAFSVEDCELALSDLPSTGFGFIGLGGVRDTRRQATFRVRAGKGGAHARMVSIVVDALGRAHPGWCLRGGEAYVIEGGSVVQPGHCDFMLDKRGELQEDSVTVFICLCAAGRAYELMGVGGGRESASGSGGCFCSQLWGVSPWAGAG